MTEPEIVSSNYNFRSQILVAIDNAPIVELSDSGETDIRSLKEAKDLQKFICRPSDELIPMLMIDQSGDILIEEAHAFPILVRQALELVYPFTPRELVDEWCRETIEHEMAHATAATMLGKDIQYGVRIIKVQDERGLRNLMSGFINLKDQNITKSELAFITAAPEKLGENDEHLLKALGYYALCR